VNSTSIDAAAAVAPEKRSRSFADRALTVIPVVGIALAVLTFYGIEAWLRKTPWVFTDELEWTQISRSIEETGHAARRGEPIIFKTLYAFAIAPFWAIHSTETAYAAIKYANTVMMTLAAVPTYLLARMLLSKRASLVVALLTICIPGMAYVTTLIPEVLGYTWYAVCSWLIVRALVRQGWVDYLWAVGASVIALLVRAPQFATVPASFLIAAGILWLAGPRGRAFRRNHSLRDQIGAVVLFAGALIVFNRVVLQQIEIWQISTQYWKDRMVDLGLAAGLAFTVGMGILPVIGGLASLFLVERRSDPVYRAFAAYLAASIFCLVLYTAVKAAYLSTIFSTLTEERNLIYLSPLMLIGTALVLQAKRIDWRIVAAASVLVVFLIYDKDLQLLFPYFEAPGFAILTIPNRHLGWDVADLRLGLVVVLVLSLAILAARRFRPVVAAAAVLSCAWMLTAEIATTVGFNNLADDFRGGLPAQLDWVDRATNRQPVTYLGQAVKDPNLIMLTEFWNRSLRHVYSLDGTAPPPGPTGTPNVVSADGRLSGIPEDSEFVLADNGVTLQAPVIASWGQMRLYQKQGPWRLLEAEQQVYTDRWAPGWSTYTYFTPGQHGTLEVTLSRTAVGGDAPPGNATVTVSTVGFDSDRGGPVQGRVFAERHTVVQNGQQQTLRFPVEKTPVRVEIDITPTFRASTSDPRDLGAQVGFAFVPEPG
jgi:hypothetical protein